MTDTTPGISIIGVGHQLASVEEDNATLCGRLDVSPDWIIEKTGIKRRYLVGPGETASSMSVEAATRALAMAGITGTEVDLIVACTFSADYIFPPLSAKVHGCIGAKGAQTFDLQANCAGFVAGLTVAADRMKSDPTLRHALVIGVEVNSPYVDRADVNTAIYLSDGAGAVVLGRSEPATGIRASAFFTDSANYEAVRMRGGGSSFRGSETAADAVHMEMSGIATWKQAITHLPPTVRKACEKSGIALSDIDFFVFHQANYNLIEFVVKRLGASMARTFTNVQEIGNTGAASVGIALSESVARGLIKPGDDVVLAAVGAGFNFGASVWRWTLPPQGNQP